MLDSNKTRRVSTTRIAFLVMCSLVACMRGAVPPQVKPNGTLGLGNESSIAQQATGPFAVVFASPKGQTDEPSEVTIVFNRPMRPLQLAGNESLPPVTLTPPVEGRWNWVGTTALQFIPKDRIPLATSFKVEVPAGTKALDGSMLKEAFRFEFQTARPELVNTEPYAEYDHLQPTSPITLYFNQAIDETEIRRAVKLMSDAGKNKTKTHAFEIKRIPENSDASVQLIPVDKFPLDTSITLSVDTSLKGREGNLTAQTASSIHFKTYGPQRVSFDCNTDSPHKQCAPGSLDIRFENPVRIKDLKNAITVSPHVKWQLPSYYSEEDTTSSVYLTGRFAPSMTYRVSVATSVRDKFGQPISGSNSGSLTFDDYWPSISLGINGGLMEAQKMKNIPVVSINHDKYGVVLAKPSEAQVILWSRDFHYERLTMKQMRSWSVVHEDNVVPKSAKNKVDTYSMDIKKFLGESFRGPVAVGVHYRQRQYDGRMADQEITQLIQITDLAISAKVSQHGSLVWVTRLSTGEPVRGATVEIHDSSSGPFATVTTDENGFATIDASKFKPSNQHLNGVIVVRFENDWAYRSVSDTLYEYRAGVSASLDLPNSMGLLFTDRGVYRPGDTVHVKAMLRKDGHPGLVVPKGEPVEIQVNSPQGDEIASVNTVVSAFGTVSTEVPIPASAKLGSYLIQTNLGGENIASEEFMVAEYRPVEFEVKVESDKPSYIRGDNAHWTASGNYLFGGVMAEAEFNMMIMRSPTYFRPEGMDGYSVSDDVYTADFSETNLRESLLQNTTGKLDKKGVSNISAPLTMPGQTGAEMVTCETTITDFSRQTVSASTSAIVHPGEFYLGVKTGDYFAEVGTTVSVEVMAADPKGSKVSSIPVKVDLIERSWTVANETSDEGYYHRQSTPVDKVVATCNRTTEVKPVTCPLKLEKAGYYIVRASALDKRKNPITSSTSLYATGEGTPSWADSDSSVLSLVADKEQYEVGQIAKILVKSPFRSAQAIVTVERDGIYQKKRIAISSASQTLSIPIEESLRPNAFVSVLLVKGRSKDRPEKLDQADVGAPTYRWGYTTLRVNPEAKRLSIGLKSDKSDYRPGETATVDIEVKDRNGRPTPSEVTFYAVDEGVLALTGYTPPDPIQTFGAVRGLGVLTIESRDSLMRWLNPYASLGLDKGLDGGGGAEGAAFNVADARRDFRATAVFKSVLVDGTGKAKVTFKLPESLTTYRLMAVAASQDDRFGFTSNRVTTSRPIMARPALPRFLRAGDRLEAGVVVSSKTKTTTSVDVEAFVTGLSMSGETKKKITLEPNQSTEVRFQMRADRVGDATLRFTATSAAGNDSVEVKRQIATPLSLEAVALYGDTETSTGEKIADLSSIRDDIGGMDVSMASTALVGLNAAVEQLIDYPYLCTEQLTSRLVPLLTLRDLAKDYRFDLPKDTQKFIQSTVAKILSRQNYNGGFAFWDNGREDAWATTYALWGLSFAKKYGEYVPNTAIESGTSYLRNRLREKDSNVMFSLSPFILDVLAELGKPDPARANTLFEQRAKLPLFSKAFLAHAMVIGKGDPSAILELEREMQNTLRIDANEARAVTGSNAYAALMDSDTRTTALVLRALLSIRNNHPLASKLVRGLLSDRKGGTWRNTQESAWSLIALNEYRKQIEKADTDFTARVFLGNAIAAEGQFHGRSLSQVHALIPASVLQKTPNETVAFDVDGKGHLFYEARLRYARKELPKDAIERGFFVKKSMHAVRPEQIGDEILRSSDALETQYRGTDLVMVDVTVVTPSPRNYVVVDDPLPAGFEAVNTDFQTSAPSMRSAQSEPCNDDNEWGCEADFVRELRDDRVLYFIDHMPPGLYHYRYLARATSIGTFVTPPTRAEEMYTPELFGRTGSHTIVVSP